VSRKEREAIQTLAALVARLAAGCWADLGTDESHDITQLADKMFKDMLPPLKLDPKRDYSDDVRGKP
jgi:hypothetical protein